MKSDFQNIFDLYEACKVEWELNRKKWIDISKFVGINVDTDYLKNQSRVGRKGDDVDTYVDDPTAALCVNQSGDYVMGLMWGTGDKVFKIKPSRFVLELVDQANVADFYDFATEQALYHMNHEDAGLTASLSAYCYDQMAFGTSGIGTFLNKAYKEGREHNVLVFSNYGVDNTVVDEGKSGQCEIVFVVYNWKVNRIVGEFCEVMEDGTKSLSNLPKCIQDAYNNKDYNHEFKIVFGFFPREDYHPTLKGKRGAKYRGVWFMDSGEGGKTFFEEDFIERPIAIARAIKVRGEVYGRASGTMLNSTIKGVNFMVGTAIEVMEKMSEPALGTFGNALFGDSVLDTSPRGMTVFNQALAGQSGAPVFPLYDVGDPTNMLRFLVPYLNEKITTGFKVDALLDFSSAKEMTATESLQRYAIRGKSLSSMLLKQKNECLVPMAKRAISLLLSVGELGVDPSEDEAVKRLRNIGQDRRVIPAEVVEVMKQGKPWFDLEWHNELEKMTRTESVQNLVQLIQSVTVIASMYPDIIQAIDWYKLLADINNDLETSSQILLSADEFQERIAAAAAERNQMMAVQAAESGSKSMANMAKAKKDSEPAQGT
jgi:hypothetical protein